jgi:flagellar hook-length control protein FliK
MTIEAGPKPNGVRTAAADTRNQKNKPSAADNAGGGFGAILASLDSSETVVQPVVNAIKADAGVGDVSTTSMTTRANFSVSGLTPPDATTVCEMDIGLDALALAEPEVSTEFGEIETNLLENPLATLATATLPIVVTAVPAVPHQDSAATAALPVFDAAAVPKPVPIDAMALVTLASQWSSPNTQNSQAEGMNSFANAAPLGLVGGKPLITAVKLEGVPEVPLALNEPLATLANPGKLLRDIAAKQLQMHDALTAKEPQAGRELESRALQLIAKSVEQTTSPIAMTVAAASTTFPALREDQPRDRLVFRSNASESSAVGQSFLSIGASTGVQYTPEVQISPDVYVAEKVAYWISNDVQNAELKLDGVGLDPVEVSIRMHGNEAHVAFRTDELQARAALENASTHLKELLQREGLVLTGVSVGTAGAGDSGDREGKPRQGNRQTNISVISELPARSGSVTGRSTGGRLDLFV